MTTVTENDLKELKDLMISQNQKLDKLASDITDIKINQTKLEGKVENLSSQMSDLKEYTSKKLDDTNNRLNTMTIGFLTIVGVLVTGLLGIIGKLVFFPQV